MRVRGSPWDEVRIKAVPSRGANLEPKAELRLARGRSLVLFGTAVAMEQAEQRLLEGTGPQVLDDPAPPEGALLAFDVEERRTRCAGVAPSSR